MMTSRCNGLEKKIWKYERDITRGDEIMPCMCIEDDEGREGLAHFAHKSGTNNPGDDFSREEAQQWQGKVGMPTHRGVGRLGRRKLGLALVVFLPPLAELKIPH